MNTRYLIVFLIAVILLSACAPTNTQSQDTNQETEEKIPPEQEVLEMGTYGLVAVPIGALEAGKTYYFIPGATSGGVSVTSVTRGVAIGILTGILVDRLIANGPGLIQDLTEGPQTFYWDGRLTTVNRATGQIKVIMLEDADAAEADNAKSRDDALAKAQEEKKVNQVPSKLIIQIEDDPSIRRSIEKTLIRMGFQYMGYSSCEEALPAISALDPFAFIVDNNLGYGLMAGPECIKIIRTVKPRVLIIGFSGGISDPGFVQNGANQWLGKDASPQDLLDLLKQ